MMSEKSMKNKIILIVEDDAILAVQLLIRRQNSNDAKE
jgi:hypothetical protein